MSALCIYVWLCLLWILFFCWRSCLKFYTSSSTFCVKVSETGYGSLSSYTSKPYEGYVASHNELVGVSFSGILCRLFIFCTCNAGCLLVQRWLFLEMQLVKWWGKLVQTLQIFVRLEILLFLSRNYVFCLFISDARPSSNMK